MIEKYKDIVGDVNAGKLPELRDSKKQPEDLEIFVSDLADVVEEEEIDNILATTGRNKYYFNQDALIKFMGGFIGKGKTKLTGSETLYLIRVFSKLTLRRACNNFGIIFGFITSPEEFFGGTIRNATDFVGYLLTLNDAYDVVDEWPDLKKDGPVAGAHYPELCLAWLESLPTLTQEDWRNYRKVYINCPVDIQVYNENGQLINSIINNVPGSSEDVQVDYDDNGQKVIYLPQDADYKLNIIPTDNGQMNYTVVDYNLDSSTETAVTAYTDLNLTVGNNYTGIIPKLGPGAVQTNSVLADSNGNTLTPTKIEKGSQVKSYKVTVEAKGNGIVLGGGDFNYGQYAKVEAVPENGNIFEGWYNQSGTLISNENPYRFEIKNDVTLRAQFKSETTPSIPSQDQNNSNNDSYLNIYRLYNNRSGEHLYTSDANEKNVLSAQADWNYEGISWKSPTSSSEAVYRLYSPVTGFHLYTTDTNEVNVLSTQRGWSVDNNGKPLYYSGGNVKIFRLYNEGLKQHLLTTDLNEYNTLPSFGWTQEGHKLNGAN